MASKNVDILSAICFYNRKTDNRETKIVLLSLKLFLPIYSIILAI